MQKKTHFLEHMEEHQQRNIIYIDIQGTPPLEASMYTAEISAIKITLKENQIKREQN